LQLESCLPRPELLSGYHALTDGYLIHSVWLQIDPEPSNLVTKVIDEEGISLTTARCKNVDAIVRNLQALYEDELCQTVLVLPDCYVLGQTPGKIKRRTTDDLGNSLTFSLLLALSFTLTRRIESWFGADAASSYAAAGRRRAMSK
jgi:hypothetical protein